MNWRRHSDNLNDWRRQRRNYNHLTRYRSKIMYWVRHHVTASTEGGSCNLNKQEIDELLNILKETKE